MNTMPVNPASFSADSSARQTPTIRILYVVLTAIFCLAMLADGIAGVVQEQTGQEVMRHLGYPTYIMIITGTAKILGALALVQNRFRGLKEWAFAGFTFNFLGASASWAFVDPQIGSVAIPLVALAFLLTIYVLWKKVDGQHGR